MKNEVQNSLLQQIPLAQMKALVPDLFTPNPLIYWLDFLFSASMAWGLFIAVELQPTLNLTQYIAFFISGLFFYRSLLFIHELTHRQRAELPGFSIVWNLLMGIPTLFPSFMYRGAHNDHHKKNTYGTKDDGEYIPFGASSPWKMFFYLSQSFYIPFLLVLRFAVIFPISYLHPKLRKYVMEHMSALAIDFSVKRSIPKGIDLRHWHVQEFLCFLYVITMIVLFSFEILPIATLRHVYLLVVLLFLVNSVRTLAAHRYNHTNGTMSFTDQLLDSVNVDGPAIFTETWAPVGLRYHGLHHLFPTMPYHALGTAHRRFMKELPEDSLYHKTVEYSLWSALKHLWDHSRATSNKSPSSSHSISYHR